MITAYLFLKFCNTIIKLLFVLNIFLIFFIYLFFLYIFF